jgi:hypothetical protein
MSTSQSKLSLIDLCFYDEEHTANWLQLNQRMRHTTQLKDAEGWHILFFCSSAPSPTEIKDRSSRIIGQCRHASAEMRDRLERHGLLPTN